MHWGRGPSQYICFDQRLELQRMLVRLFATNNATRRTIELGYE